jgi:pantetheine-phosphate adenylyltransferase
MTASPRLAVFPGSFDPLTNGHVDVVGRAARLFDRVVVAILVNADKQPLFSTDERVGMLREAFADEPRVEVDTFDGLLADYAARRGASAIVRGVRTAADFEYERQMASMNRHLQGGVETVLLLPSERYAFVSSRLVKEVASLGGSVTGLVPAHVDARLRLARSGRR